MTSICRRLGLVCGVICVAQLAGGCGGGASVEKQLNVLLITLDTLRADRLGCYGYPEATSPWIDDFAEAAFVFERAISQSAITPVSHASILTGRNPYRHGLRSLHGGKDDSLSEDQLTLAELLGERGYATAAFVSAFPASRHYGLHQGFATWDQDFRSSDGEGLITESGIVNTDRAQRRGDETTERALRWLAELDDEASFLLWVHYFDVHDPVIRAPDAYLRRFKPRSRRKADVLRATYDGELAFMDEQVGRLLSELDRSGLGDRSVVVILADHGEGLGDHQWWGHGILYQEQVRVPFLLSVPGMRGRGIDANVRTIDLLPTLLDLLQLEPPPGAEFDGRSLLGLLEGGDQEPRVAYSESINDLLAYSDSPLRSESLYAVNDGRWKLILHREGGTNKAHELFDLRSDPREELDLADQRPEEARRLMEYLERLQPFAAAGGGDPPDEETLRKLQALGYLK
jgi:arylsulfatase A-like enzyme